MWSVDRHRGYELRISSLPVRAGRYAAWSPRSSPVTDLLTSPSPNVPCWLQYPNSQASVSTQPHRKLRVNTAGPIGISASFSKPRAYLVTAVTIAEVVTDIFGDPLHHRNHATAVLLRRSFAQKWEVESARDLDSMYMDIDA
jgi:hypothetical protein